ncbi:MAG: hypothetical protein JWO36_3379 [Myxococcales bacterium]|nr:hypothetical protein [Myxococcales bacterium]
MRVFCLMMLLASRVAYGQCSTDNDCKGTRVCENQVCVSPAPKSVPATTPTAEPVTMSTAPATPAVVGAAPATPAASGVPNAPVAGTTIAAAPGESDEFGHAGFEFGMRIADLIPSGKFAWLSSSGSGLNSSQDVTLSQATGGGFDLVFDLGQRVNRMVFWGIQVAYAPSMTQPDPCAYSCKNSNFRIGGDVMIHPHVAQLPPKFDPFIGFGVNYDQFTVGTESTMPIGVYGMEFVNVQVGTDYLVRPHVSAGVYLSTSFGMYFGADHSKTEGVQLHEWFSIGIRGAYRL